MPLSAEKSLCFFITAVVTLLEIYAWLLMDIAALLYSIGVFYDEGVFCRRSISGEGGTNIYTPLGVDDAPLLYGLIEVSEDLFL